MTRGDAVTKKVKLSRRESFNIIYYLPIKEHRLTEEEASGFLLWFQSRLDAIERNYISHRPSRNGKALPFADFLASCVRKRCANYLYERNREEFVRNAVDRFYYNNEIEDKRKPSAAGSDPSSVAETYFSKTEARKSRITTLILMLAPFIEYDDAEKMARRCRLEVKPFMAKFELVRTRYRDCYGERIRKNRERSNTDIVKAVVEDAEESENTGQNNPWLSQRRYKRCVDKSVRRKNRFDSVVPIKMVSQVQNIPYNTALSNLRILKKEVEAMSKDGKL